MLRVLQAHTLTLKVNELIEEMMVLRELLDDIEEILIEINGDSGVSVDTTSEVGWAVFKSNNYSHLRIVEVVSTT